MLAKNINFRQNGMAFLYVYLTLIGPNEHFWNKIGDFEVERGGPQKMDRGHPPFLHILNSCTVCHAESDPGNPLIIED